MSSKIYKALSDLFSINAEYDAKMVEVKKIIDSCRTSQELKNCDGLLKSINNQLKNSIERFYEENRFINFITVNAFGSFLIEKMDCKMSKINDYHSQKIKSRIDFEQSFEKNQTEQ